LIAPLVDGIRLFEAQGFAPFRAGFAKRDVLLGQALRLATAAKAWPVVSMRLGCCSWTQQLGAWRSAATRSACDLR